MAHKQLVEICNQQVEIDLQKTNWIPFCMGGEQWYAAEVYFVDNSIGVETATTKIYKQGADGTIVTSIAALPKIDGYCSDLTSCASIGDTTTVPSKLLSNAEIDTIMFNLLGVNVPKQYANLPSTAFPQTINYQGTSGNIFYGYNIDLSKYTCGSNVIANVTLMYTPLGDSDPVDTGLDIVFLAANTGYNTLNFNSIISGTAFPSYPTKVVTKLYPALPTTVQTIGATYNVTGLDSLNIVSYVQGITAADKVRIEGIMVEITGGNFTDCFTVTKVKDCNSEATLDVLKQMLAQSTNKIQRSHENYVITGTTPLVIPSGLISISVTKTNGTGVVNISGDNGTNYPLTVLNENFSDGVNEAVSTLSAYIITGSLGGTTYKVHLIR